LALSLFGCSGPTTTRLLVDVSKAGSATLSSVTVTVYDPYGEIGHASVTPAAFPGQLVVTGLPERAVNLRITAAALDGNQEYLGATRATVAAHQQVTASIMLTADTPDEDHDQVPDSVDDCPTMPDPRQLDSTGMPPGDACSTTLPPLPTPTTPQLDLSIPPDLTGAPPPPPDMTRPRDLVGAPPPPPPPDMSRVPSTCASSTVALCDGFEGTTLANWWSTRIHSGGTYAIDTKISYRGNSSLHLTNSAIGASGGSDVEIDEGSVFFNHFYVRVFAYVPKGFDPSEADVLLVEQGSNPYEGITLGLENNSFITSDTLNGGTVLSTTTTFVNNTWVCLEWEVKLGSSGSSPNGTTTLSVDGKVAPGLGASQPLYGGSSPISQIALSLLGYANTAARELWLDELMIDTSPIGCAK
jgi:hypothetical protein